MSEKKQVKVDNWGIYFLQRLKHFFNRTDYCDLTLQFQDNAQLKVHRLVLSACTEYFELLERTCEMYEDCLVMPDDLQADVIVPIVNFMYTGNLEFQIELAERLYQTAQVLNMPVLTKLLESHRHLVPKPPTHSYSGKKFPKQSEAKKSTVSAKRSYSKAFDNVVYKDYKDNVVYKDYKDNVVYKDKKTYQTITKKSENTNSIYRPPSPGSVEVPLHRHVVEDPRPTRYEVPEELESDNFFDTSFSNISYTSEPLVVHPDTVKRYKAAKRNTLFAEASSSKKGTGLSTVDIVECKRVVHKDDSIFNESNRDHTFNDDTDLFNTSYVENEKDSNQLFDQIIDNNGGPKVTIETKDSKAASNLDHARIISEVLKKYPHLVKSNKNIKLKILDPVPSKDTGRKKQAKSAGAGTSSITEVKPLKTDEDDFTYETDVIDSKQAAKLIAMGAENVKGPWICLICGTPGKALHFNSYYKFRRHLVDVHHEKPVPHICEYCGLRSLKRNYLLHHLYAQHGVQPPPQYHFPKCNMCSYIALTEGLLVKHKLTHKDIKNFRCNVCYVAFSSSSQLLIHIQNTGHKYSSEKKNNLQCIYCLKVFLRETNLYAHLKTHHKKEAKTDCIIDSSDDEKVEEHDRPRTISIKYEPGTSYENDFEEMDLDFPSQQISTSDKHSTPRKQAVTTARQKILNPGFSTPKSKPGKSTSNSQSQNDFFQDVKMPIQSNNEEIVVINQDEYIMKDNQLIPRKKPLNEEFILSDIVDPSSLQPTTSVEYTNVENATIEENVQPQSSMIIKKSTNLNQPIQIVVSNEEEYKALMNSNHPIIFDNGDPTKTLTVLTAQQAGIETGTIDLDNASSSEMMILPTEYPLNVTEAVATDNPNIVVVYSHDDQNKQYQILTTGGIGAQFVQSSGMITQTFETVTTSTPTINQVEQNWQSNIESMETQQIQLAHPQHTDHTETTDNLHHLTEVHMLSEPHNTTDMAMAPSETEISLNPPVEIIEQINTSPEDNINSEPSSISLTTNETNVIHTDQNNIVEPMQIQNVLEEPLEIENAMKVPPVSENIIEQPMDTESITEQPIGVEDMQEQPMATENIIDQPTQNENITETIETEYVIEQPPEADIVMEQQPQTNELEMPIETGSQDESEQRIETENKIEEPVMSANILEQTTECGNMIEQPPEDETVLEHRAPSDVLEQAIESQNIIEQTQELQNIIEQPVERENILEQQSSIENSTIQPPPQDNIESKSTSEYPEVENTGENAENQNDQEPQELMESQAYDEIVQINNASEEQTVNPKEGGSKIQNLALEWSEDEYDMAEDQDHNNKTAKPNADTQKIPFIDDGPELEESIENIQQEMQKQMASQHTQIETPDVETEESAVSSQEEDSSSQEQLPPLIDSPGHGPIPNPQVQQKLSSLLNDWEDNDSQEDVVPDNSSHENVLPKTDTNKPQDIPKNDNIRSLVSDWDDDDDKE